MADLVAEHARRTPGKMAVIDDRPGCPVVRYTFAELDRRANQLAWLLADRGVTSETKVAWCGQNAAGVLVVMAAIRKLGAVAVPLGYHLTADEAAYVLDHSDARVVYVDSARRALIEAVRHRLPQVTDVLVFEDPLLEAELARQPGLPGPGWGEDPGGEIFYTSGTTGRPKGALRKASADPGRSPLVGLMGLGPGDVYLTTGPLYHSGPARFVAMSQALGCTVVVQHRFDPEDWLRLVATHTVTSTFSAPTPIRMVCALPLAVRARYDRSSMRHMVGNAAPWSLALKQLYLRDFPADSLWEVYGAAELGVVTVLGPADQLRKPGSCGRPAPGVEVRLLADDGSEVTAARVSAELFVRSPSVFTTYYKAPESYDADRRGDFHSVGDIAYRDEEGYLHIADRKKDMIISGGMNVYSVEVEAALEQSPDVHEAAVVGLPDEVWGERVHAVVVPARPDVSADDVLAFARNRLAGYKVPRSVALVGDLPRTGSGKVLKRQLRATPAAGNAAPA
jgi:acyl-CoA synthetase (AMP-forming)/AMP-acid ligase II